MPAILPPSIDGQVKLIGATDDDKGFNRKGEVPEGNLRGPEGNLRGPEGNLRGKGG